VTVNCRGCLFREGPNTYKDVRPIDLQSNETKTMGTLTYTGIGVGHDVSGAGHHSRRKHCERVSFYFAEALGANSGCGSFRKEISRRNGNPLKMIFRVDRAAH